MSINRVNISGNLTRDAELRSTQSGTSVLTFGVAVNDRRQNPQTQQWEDYPNFIDCVVFGNRADALSDILRKGLKVAVEGKLRYRSWETDDGQRRSKLEVVVDEVELMTQRADRPQARAPQAGYPQHSASPYATPTPRRPAGTPHAAPRPTQAPYQPQAGNYAAYPQAAPNAAPQAAPAPYQPQLSNMPQPQPPTMDVYDEDIPF